MVWQTATRASGRKERCLKHHTCYNRPTQKMTVSLPKISFGGSPSVWKLCACDARTLLVSAIPWPGEPDCTLCVWGGGLNSIRSDPIVSSAQVGPWTKIQGVMPRRGLDTLPVVPLLFRILAVQLLGVVGLIVLEGKTVSQSIYLSSKTMSTVGT